MKIVYAALKYDYGDPVRGYGFEHYNFYESLVNMGHDILYFDLGTLARMYGKERMSKRLVDLVHAERPELLFCVLQQDELDPSAVDEISHGTNTVTFNWFCDDHWRFESFSSRWVAYFNWVATTAASAIPKYQASGHSNVIKTQWACNHFRYRPLDLPRTLPVTFVGLPHGNRRYVVERLRRAGIDIEVWGKGWERGRIEQDEMVRVFNQSQINLNLSNASPPSTLGSRVADALLRSLESVPINSRDRERLARKLAFVRQHLSNSRSTSAVDQIKGRNFEVPGCRTFLLTGQAENLVDYYGPDKEVALFSDVDDLISRIRYYLDRPEQRERIAAAGYERTLSEHTYVHRYAEIFQRLALPTRSAAEILADGPAPGRTEEVS